MWPSLCDGRVSLISPSPHHHLRQRPSSATVWNKVSHQLTFLFYYLTNCYFLEPSNPIQRRRIPQADASWDPSISTRLSFFKVSSFLISVLSITNSFFIPNRSIQLHRSNEKSYQPRSPSGALPAHSLVCPSHVMTLVSGVIGRQHWIIKTARPRRHVIIMFLLPKGWSLWDLPFFVQPWIPRSLFVDRWMLGSTEQTFWWSWFTILIKLSMKRGTIWRGCQILLFLANPRFTSSVSDLLLYYSFFY